MGNDKNILNLAENIQTCGRCKFFRKNYFGFYSLNKNAKMMILMQNPGAGNKRIKEEIEGIERVGEIKDKISIMRKGLNDWILNQNKVFFKRFFHILKEFKLIDFDSFESYVSSYKYLDDFYFTDVLKCRIKTNEVKEDNLNRCFDNFLSFEINYVKPEIIFSFSTRTWQTLRNKIEMNSITDRKLDNMTLARVHGYLFKIKDKDCFIIPLVHMSQQIFNNLLRDSYFEYLNEGLKTFVDIKHFK